MIHSSGTVWGSRPSTEQLGEGEGVAGVGVDGTDGGLAGGQVVGVAGVDPGPVPLGRLGHDPVGPEAADDPGDVPPEIEVGVEPAVGVAEEGHVGDPHLGGRGGLLVRRMAAMSARDMERSDPPASPSVAMQ
jgi:hypothetical protein